MTWSPEKAGERALLAATAESRVAERSRGQVQEAYANLSEEARNVVDTILKERFGTQLIMELFIATTLVIGFVLALQETSASIRHEKVQKELEELRTLLEQLLEEEGEQERAKEE